MSKCHIACESMNTDEINYVSVDADQTIIKTSYLLLRLTMLWSNLKKVLVKLAHPPTQNQFLEWQPAASPLQRTSKRPQQFLALSGKLGRKYANFLFFFINKHSDHFISLTSGLITLKFYFKILHNIFDDFASSGLPSSSPWNRS